MASKAPIPPATLSKETVGVWNGWGRMGDREVAREAATKGTHVDLAITFLSVRMEIPQSEAQSWFTVEVSKWVSELLDRKQIFRASHILNNIKLNPNVEFSKYFYTTINDDLRNYIGEHLVKAEKLESNLKQHWDFLRIIFDNFALVSKYKLPEDSIECLDKQPKARKTEIATTLFLKTYDVRLAPFLNGEVLWKHLLAKSDSKSIKAWINIKYDPEDTPLTDEINPNLRSQFKMYQITNDMLNSEIDPDIQDEIFNEFSKFGIFPDKEKNDFFQILKRWRNSDSIANLNQILSSNNSVIHLNHFTELLIEYCLHNGLYIMLNECIKHYQISKLTGSPHLQLIQNCRNLVESFDEDHLCDNIVRVVSIISDDPQKYYQENPLIILSMLLFSPDAEFVDLAKKGSSIIIADVVFSKSLLELVAPLPILNAISNHFINGPPKTNLTVYDLIEKHLKFNCRKFFEQSLPSFNSEELIENFGYSKEIDYKFYLKQCRPNAAANLVLEDKMMLSTEDVKNLERKAVKLAILNFARPEITSSCVAFLEMIRVDSINLRTKIRSAQILLEAGYGTEFTLELLLNSDDEPYALQNVLETILIETTDENDFKFGSKTVEVFKNFDVLVKYSKLNNLKLPESLLIFCARKNLWLPFLMFAQIHGYPPEQLKLLMQFFQSRNMGEHLTHSVLNDIQVEEKNILIRERDSRKYFLSKVGVKRSVEVFGENLSNLSQGSQLSGASSSGSSDAFEIDISNIKATLLQTLIRCHNSTDPPKALLQACQLYRNPLLAIFATSYEPDSLVTNWLTWLAVSCELNQTFTNYETVAMSAISVTNLLENCAKKRYLSALHESFQIFLPENPLMIFVEFLLSCVKFDFKVAPLASKLNEFQLSLRKRRKSSVLNETDHEMTYLQNRIWIETTALRLLSATLDHNCGSLYEQILFTRTLKTVNISDYFATEFVPNFDNILRILDDLFAGKSGVKLNISQIFDPATSREAVISCINALLANHEYATALKIARIEDLPPDLILVKEWQNKFENRTETFWHECDENLNSHKVTADCVVDFYTECAEKVDSFAEKYTVTKLASDWAHRFDLSCRYELEKKMWIAFLCLDEKHKNFDSLKIKPHPYLYRDLSEILDKITPHEEELNKDLVRQIERILLYVLNEGDLWQALKLQKMFNCKCADLETLKLSCNLAEGMILPYQLNSEQRLLLSNVSCVRNFSHRRTFLSTRLSGFSSASHSPANSSMLHTSADGIETAMNDTLAILKLLSEHLHNGIEIGKRIFMTYRIAINIEIPYNVVTATSDYMGILRDALEDDCMNKLDVIHDFIKVYKWSKDEIADFVCEEIVNATSHFVQSTLAHVLMWDLDLDHAFPTILQLLQDNCSILGNKIYSYTATFYQSQVESNSEFTTSDLSLIIELMIRAHDCFTADCNMEGISIILKKSKKIICLLLTSQKWKLIVRLLTGVARYTEMSYVFHILMENDQFEFLLRKGSCKDNTLKVALLEYLKKYCPDNRDLYKIVALHFTLFSEVALLWEKEARSVIKNLISISKLEMQNNKLNPDEEPFILFQNTDGTKICLKKAMENYTHATEFHLQGEKLSKATEAAKLAELVALQMALLAEVSGKSSALCLLNLNSSQIFTLITSQLNFEQTIIVTQAYDYTVDWTLVLYEQFIIRSNSRFFQGFLSRFPLTENLVYEISKKFIATRVNTISEIKNMKKVIEFVTSVHVKYKVASELGFTDLVADMIASGQLVYLKDTVWKKGYKN